VGIQERREREKREQRQRILDAALTIINKEGFAALSMRKLAEQIEYSPASIYLYFENRERIAQELSDAGFEEMLDAISAAISGKKAVEALHALGSAYIAYGVEHPEIYRLVFMGDSDYMAAAYAEHKKYSAANRAYGVLVQLADELTESGRNTQDLPSTVIAEMIWSALHGIVSLHIACPGFQSATPQNMARFATGMIAQSFFKPTHATASPNRKASSTPRAPRRKS